MKTQNHQTYFPRFTIPSFSFQKFLLKKKYIYCLFLYCFFFFFVWLVFVSQDTVWRRLQNTWTARLNELFAKLQQSRYNTDHSTPQSWQHRGWQHCWIWSPVRPDVVYSPGHWEPPAQSCCPSPSTSRTMGGCSPAPPKTCQHTTTLNTVAQPRATPHHTLIKLKKRGSYKRQLQTSKSKDCVSSK